MRIGVVSDTHNNLKNIDKIISLFNKEDISFVIHTGDITNASALEKFTQLNSKLIGVYGNNDRNEKGLKEVAKKYNFQFQEPPKLLSLCKKNIAIFHEPELIEDFLLKKEKIDIVIHGHTHRFRQEVKSDVLFFNPGESAGWLEGSNAIGVIDLVANTARRIFF
tara:strand:- start:41236 stop:41727 length:492 start_codon:yes stop_codon:yes gene_type:complete